MRRPPPIALSVLATIFVAPPVFAADPSSSPQSQRSPAPLPHPDTYETRRIVDVTLFVGGLAVASAGSYLAIKYNRAIGACDARGYCPQEDGRVPLGLGMMMVGAALAGVGAVFWLKIPSSSTRVSMAPNALFLGGVF
jgi:hypothetical protein